MPEAQPGLGRLGGLFGGGRGGGGATVSAGFKIDDSSIKKLNQQWAALVQHVRDFNAELRKIDSRKLDALGRGMGGGQRLGVNSTYGGGTLSVGGYSTPLRGASTPPTVAGSAGAPGGGGAAPAGGGGGQGGGDGRTRFGSLPAPVKAATVVGGGIVGYGISHYNNMVDAERFAQTSAWGMGGSTSNNMGYVRHFMFGGNGQPGLTGFQNTQDALAGGRLIQSNLAYGMRTPEQQGYYKGAGRMGNVLGGYEAGARASVGMYNTGTFYNLMSIGVQTRTAGGKQRSPEQIARDFLLAVYGRMPSEQEVAEGLQQGAPLRANMDAMGLAPEVQDWIAQYGMLSAKIQGQAGATDKGVARMRTELSRTGGKSDAGKRAIGKSVYQTQMRKGQQQAELEQELADSALPAMRYALEGATRALDVFTDTLTGTGLAGPTGALAGGGAIMAGPLNAAMGMAGGMGGFALMNWLSGRRNGRGGGGPGGGGGGGFGGGGGGGDCCCCCCDDDDLGGKKRKRGGRGSPPVIIPPGGGRGGLRGLGGRAAGRAGLIGLGAAGAYMATDFIADRIPGTDQQGWGQGLGDAARWAAPLAAGGAAIGGPLGAGIGAAIGGTAGFVHGMWFGGQGKTAPEQGGPGGSSVGGEEVDILAGVLSGSSLTGASGASSTPSASSGQDDSGANRGDEATDVPAGQGATSRGARALAWMMRQSKSPSQSWLNLCLKDVRMSLGVGPKHGDANAAYYATKKRHEGTPPPGVPVWWTNNRHGHVALSAGGGKVWSNDIKRKGQIDLASIDEITRRWGATYRGWSEDINGVDVWDPPQGSSRSGRVGKMTPGQIFKLARDAGFDRNDATLMVAIAGGESTFNAGTLNDTKSTGDLSYGLWQINMLGDLGPARRRAFKLKNNEELFDPATNARAAWEISGHGKTFTPWSAYKNGAYKRYMSQARSAAASLPNYRQGAYEIHGDQLALIHHGEMVVPADDARRVRDYVRKRQAQPASTAKSRGAVQVTLNMPIHMASGTPLAEAERIVNLVAARMERDSRILAVMGGD